MTVLMFPFSLETKTLKKKKKLKSNFNFVTFLMVMLIYQTHLMIYCHASVIFHFPPMSFHVVWITFTFLDVICTVYNSSSMWPDAAYKFTCYTWWKWNFFVGLCRTSTCISPGQADGSSDSWWTDPSAKLHAHLQLWKQPGAYTH